MKSKIITILLAALPVFAHAQTSSSAQTAAQSSAANQGNNQAITFGAADVPGHSSQTLRSAPPVAGSGFYGSFSSDSCMVSAGGGGSVVGFGMNFATPIEDRACSLRRNFERIQQASASTLDVGRRARLQQASIDVLCATDAATRQALTDQGLCSAPPARGDMRGLYPTVQR